MNNYFITATGTDIGKTLVTAALCYQLRAEEKQVLALKPVMSGFDAVQPEESDTGVLLDAQGLLIQEDTITMVSPWRFRAALSPDMAAAEERRALQLDKIVSYCKAHEKEGRTLLVEGVGGVAVPLSSEHLILDWMAALNYKVLLVAGNYLGSMSHILTAIAALKAYNITPHAVILSENCEEGICTAHMQHSLRSHISANTKMHILPRITSTPQWKAAPNMVDWL